MAFKTQVDFSKYMNMGINPNAVAKGAGWEAFGKAMNAVANTMDEVGHANDLKKVEELRRSGATNMEGVETYSGKNQKLFDDVITANKTKASQGLLSKVYSGELTQDQYKEQVSSLGDGVVTPEVMEGVNSYYDDKKTTSQITDMIELRAKGLKYDQIKQNMPNLTKTALAQLAKYQDEDLQRAHQEKVRAQAATDALSLNELKHEQALQLQDEKAKDAKELVTTKATTTQTESQKLESKNINNLEKKILDQANETKAKELVALKSKLNNGDISKNEYIAQATNLSKEPLDKKVADKFDTRINYLKALDGLIDQHRKGELSRSTGFISAMTPNITDAAHVNESLLKQLLLGKTDQLSGTLSDKDMSILQATGLNENLSDDDFVDALIKTRAGIANNIKNDYTDYAKSNDISTNITNGVKSIRAYDPVKKQWLTQEGNTAQDNQKQSIVKNNAATNKTAIATGTTKDGKKVVKYSDGSIEYVN